MGCGRQKERLFILRLTEGHSTPRSVIYSALYALQAFNTHNAYSDKCHQVIVTFVTIISALYAL